MKLHRFIGRFDLSHAALEADDRALFDQLKNVLKLSPGERVVLSDGEGNEAEAAIERYGNNSVYFTLGARRTNAAEAETRVTLYLAVIKRDRFEYAAQKAVETGIARIVPIVTARTVKLNLALPRIRDIMREAAEQSGRGIVPGLSEPVSFAEACEAAAQHEANIIFDPSGIPFRKPAPQSLGAFVGPEGGFTPEELELAKKSGIIAANLGPRILRAETAATVISYLLCLPARA